MLSSGKNFRTETLCDVQCLVENFQDSDQLNGTIGRLPLIMALKPES